MLDTFWVHFAGAARRREFHNLPFGRDLGFHGGWGGRGDISSLGGGWGLS